MSYASVIFFHFFFRVQSNTGLNLDKSQRLRMKYYDKVRSHHTEENRRRNSMIPEETEETERTPLLAQNPAGFLVNIRNI